MDKDLIMNQLRKIVQQRGGKFAPKINLGDVSEMYKNQYIDDGSIDFEALRVDVAKKIAKKFYGADGVRELSAVPESAIKKVMQNLEKKRGLVIKELIKTDKYNMKAIDILQKDKNAVKFMKQLKQANDLDLGARYNKIKYPELERYKGYESTLTVPPKMSKQLLEEISSLFYDTAAATYPEDEPIEEGSGLKKKKSKYNVFVSQYMKKHKGATISDAAKAWSK